VALAEGVDRGGEGGVVVGRIAGIDPALDGDDPGEGQ